MLACRHSHFLGRQGTVETLLPLQPVCGHYALALVGVATDTSIGGLVDVLVHMYLDFSLSPALQVVASKFHENISS